MEAVTDWLLECNWRALLPWMWRGPLQSESPLSLKLLITAEDLATKRILLQ